MTLAYTMTLATLFITLRRLLAAIPLAPLRAMAFASFALVLVPAAHAEGIAIQSASVEPADDGWNLEAVFDMQFSQRLEEAVNRGVPLYFVVEF